MFSCVYFIYIGVREVIYFLLYYKKKNLNIVEGKIGWGYYMWKFNLFLNVFFFGERGRNI